jgi:hypothetical protein
VTTGNGSGRGRAPDVHLRGLVQLDDGKTMATVVAALDRANATATAASATATRGAYTRRAQQTQRADSGSGSRPCATGTVVGGACFKPRSSRECGETTSARPGVAGWRRSRCPRQESNLRTRFRKPLLYPLSYGGSKRAEL